MLYHILSLLLAIAVPLSCYYLVQHNRHFTFYHACGTILLSILLQSILNILTNHSPIIYFFTLGMTIAATYITALSRPYSDYKLFDKNRNEKISTDITFTELRTLYAEDSSRFTLSRISILYHSSSGLTYNLGLCTKEDYISYIDYLHDVRNFERRNEAKIVRSYLFGDPDSNDN